MWYSNLTDEQEKITRILTGLMNDIENIFDLLGEKMSQEDLTKAKLAYIITLATILEIELPTKKIII